VPGIADRPGVALPAADVFRPGIENVTTERLHPRHSSLPPEVRSPGAEPPPAEGEPARTARARRRTAPVRRRRRPAVEPARRPAATRGSLSPTARRAGSGRARAT